MINERTFTRDPAGFTVVIPSGTHTPVPLCCPECQRALRTRDDELSYTLYSCCNACEREWVHADREAWRAGVRPDPDIVAAAVAIRPGISIRFG